MTTTTTSTTSASYARPLLGDAVGYGPVLGQVAAGAVAEPDDEAAVSVVHQRVLALGQVGDVLHLAGRHHGGVRAKIPLGRDEVRDEAHHDARDHDEEQRQVDLGEGAGADPRHDEAQDQAHDAAEAVEVGVEHAEPDLGQGPVLADVLLHAVEECDALREADEVERRAERIGQVEQRADGAAEFRAQRAGDHEVGAAAGHCAVRDDGRQRQHGHDADSLGDEEDDHHAQDADVAGAPAQLEEEDDTEDVERDGDEHAIAQAQLVFDDFHGGATGVTGEQRRGFVIAALRDFRHGRRGRLRVCVGG